MPTPGTLTIRLARLIAAVLSLLFIAFAVGNGFNPSDLANDELILASALSASLLGLILMSVPPYSQRDRIIVGAILSVFGAVGFYVLHFQFSGRWPEGYVFPLLFVPGVLQLICGLPSGSSDAFDSSNVER